MKIQAYAQKQFWETNPYFDSGTRALVHAMTEEEEILSCFGSELDFGTGGLRGLMGVGTNRINRYTVRKTSAGLAMYLKERVTSPCVVIAYDSRHHSEELAEETALTLAACGVRALLFSNIAPTPQLSFAVRYLSCDAGVVITASHNPKEYNGYKVYGPDGGQAVPAMADAIRAAIEAISDLTMVMPMTKEEAMATSRFTFLDESITDAFVDAVLAVQCHLSQDVRDDLRLVYTPLHGAGRVPIQKALTKLGYAVVTVPEQEMPNGDFPTVVSPNPEDSAALTLGIRLAASMGADLVLGTDPDSDRVGVAIRTATGYSLLTGNQIGALLTDFLITQGKDGKNAVLVKTIVTNDLGAEIARAHGIEIRETLTGFKYIGEQMTRMEQDGSGSFFFGYEESYGYLAGTHARDKDAVVASVLLCEAAALAKAQKKTLWDRLQELYARYGFYYDALDSFEMKGLNGQETMRKLMVFFRNHGADRLGSVKQVLDYQHGIDGLPKSNVLKFLFEDGSWLAIRPSGTEPKMKIYYSIRSACEMDARQILSAWRNNIGQIMIACGES